MNPRVGDVLFLQQQVLILFRQTAERASHKRVVLRVPDAALDLAFVFRRIGSRLSIKSCVPNVSLPFGGCISFPQQCPYSPSSRRCQDNLCSQHQ